MKFIPTFLGLSSLFVLALFADTEVPNVVSNKQQNVAPAKSPEVLKKQAKKAKKTPWLGLSISRPGHVVSQQLGLPQKVGFVVTETETGSPAEQAGIQVNDVLVKMDEQLLINGHQFAVLLRMKKAGDIAKFELKREGKTVNAPLIVGSSITGVKTVVSVVKDPVGDVTLPIQLVDQSQRSVNIENSAGMVSLSRANGVHQVEIKNPRGVVIFQGAAETEMDLAAIPSPWVVHVPILKSALSNYKPVKRRRVVIPRQK